MVNGRFDIVYVKQKQNQVIACNGIRRVVKRYSAIELGKDYFRMSNKAFYDKYGFNFTPNGYLFDKCKRELNENEIYFSKKFVTRVD